MPDWTFGSCHCYVSKYFLLCCGSGDLRAKLERHDENWFEKAIYVCVGREAASANECIGHVLDGGDLGLVPKLACCDAKSILHIATRF